MPLPQPTGPQSEHEKHKLLIESYLHKQTLNLSLLLDFIIVEGRASTGIERNIFYKTDLLLGYFRDFSPIDFLWGMEEQEEIQVDETSQDGIMLKAVKAKFPWFMDVSNLLNGVEMIRDAILNEGVPQVGQVMTEDDKKRLNYLYSQNKSLSERQIWIGEIGEHLGPLMGPELEDTPVLLNMTLVDKFLQIVDKFFPNNE